MQQTDIQYLNDIAAVAIAFVHPRRGASSATAQGPDEECAAAALLAAHARSE